MERNEPTHSEDPNSMASSSSASPAVGDYEGRTKKAEGNDYEVFLSFRGKDTRKGFTDHLYTSLVDAGIHVFRDDNELRVGEEIGSELHRSITQSKILIPIISEDYASSKWCLRELAHMSKCKRKEGQIVLPIFYKVEPSQVKHLTGRFGDAINAHKKNLEEMVVKEWEEALKEVGSLKGWESEKYENGHEAALVKTVVRKVMNELKRLFLLNVPEQLVGIEDHVEEILSKIDAKFDGTWIIGIYGMGGIGKTTLAKVLYNKLSSHFEGRSFLADIRETSCHDGIKCLQKQLISNIIGASVDVSNVDDGINSIKSLCTSKKVLILLDDTDDDTHLKALVGDGRWCKGGSIVIITTRNKSILDKTRVSHTYELNELPWKQSLVLFSRHAFRKDSPPRDYEDISCDVVHRTGGLPLALEVIGSFLCGKTMGTWEDTSKKLKKVPDPKVQEKLRISYDVLDHEAQQIFLDIACFFIGSSKQNPTYMWDACDFFPRMSIEVLSLMSLIKVTEDGKLTMHDQLRDLGREIVRLEDVKEPQKRSRLWNNEDAVDVLVNNKGTTKIEVLRLDSYYGRKSYTAKTFKKLTNLRFLRVNYVNLIGDCQNLLPQLRWLEWNGYFEAANFHLKKLTVLHLSSFENREDWGGWGPLKMATELKVLNLENCALRRTLDLSAFKSLEILILQYCYHLEEIHPSIEDIKTLISLNVKRCMKLKELPLGVSRMEELRELLINDTTIREIPISRGCLTKLETLNASNCELLARLPESLGSLVSLTHLYLHKAQIEEIPESIGSMKKLETLDASYCTSLARIPSSIGDLASLSHLDLTECHKLAQLPDSIGSLVSLPRLLLSGCHSLRQVPDSIGKLTSLTELHLQSTAIEELPESIGSMKELKTLDASYCASLARIPSSIGDLASLSHLDLTECHKLAQLPDSIGSLVSLPRLLLSGCHSLRQIPDSIGKLTSLTELHLQSTAIEELPESIGSMKELESLDASYCASLARIPSSIGDLASLFHLDLTECHKLAQLPDSIGSLVSLPRLLLSGCHSLRQIPDSIGKLTSLTELHLQSTAIEELPESIGSMKELESLDASYCASLARIPSSLGNLASLSHLDLTKCRKLAQLPDSIGSLVSLQHLLLSECHWLREIPDSIGKLTSLTELHLKSTAIMDLPESIGNMQNLRMLDISGTPIIQLLGDRRKLVELQGLRASRWKNLEGLPSNTGQVVLPDNLDIDELQKLSELRSHVLNLVLLKRPMTPPAYNSAMDYQTADFEHVLERSRPFGISDKVNNFPVNILPVTFNSQSDGKSSYSSNDLPRNVVITLNQESPVKSMDFHPVQQILLLVGTNTGDVMVWEVSSGARIAARKFKVWDLGTCSMALQASLANDYTVSVNRVMWSPDGILFGVAYSKHMVHIYSYHGGDDIRNHLELEAHVGSVNDLAFSYPNKQLCIVTCGDDRSIKVWDAVTGAKQQSFEGHETPVYSICPHHKENIQFIFSTATDGKIKTWLYDNMRSRVDYDALDHSSTMMAYSADGTRLFSCGTNKEGESYLVEWNESEGAVKRTYHGLGKRSGWVVQFDTAKNRFLAAGDEFMVKFWDMDNNNLLTSTDADGGLPASPCIRFNKAGILLAVSTSDNNIKILANDDGIRLLRTVDNRPFDASRITPEPLMKPPAIATFGSGSATFGASLGDRGAPVAAMVGMDSESMAEVKPKIADESGDESRIWKLTEINEPSQCCSIRLPNDSTDTRVSRIIYTNSGLAILALSSNAVHKLWKWQKSDRNLTGGATTCVVPQLRQPPGRKFMTNDTSDANPEDAVPCFALAKSDSYLISASGGKISMFNMMTFKTMTTFMPPPTPINDIIAIGLEDSSIQIYDARDDEVQTKLKGHQRIVIGFDLSTPLTVLVSSASDSQTITTFIRARQAATFMAFLPRDNNILAIGMDDSSIQIYNMRFDEYKPILRGHHKRITGLAFSNVLNILVSSGADSQLCVWSTDGWEKQASKFLQMPTGRGATPLANTRVQFHMDQIRLLVVHETHIATYEAPKLECLKQWVTREASGPITDATYSCNGQSIYVSFEDGSINILTASTLRLRCRINPAAYIPPNPSSRVYPLVIAAHPSEPNQFALGLTDGSVYVLEPLESEGEWGTSPPVEDGAGPSMTSGATGSDQPQR